MGLRATIGSGLPAVPGGTARLPLAIGNTGDRKARVRIELGGDGGRWGWVAPPTLTLDPGETIHTGISFRLPRAAQPAAGPLGFTVALVPEGDPDGAVEVDGALEVAPFADIAVALEPRTSRGRRGGRHVLCVENRGNAPLAASVRGEGEEVSVEAVPDRVDVAPGASVEVQLSVSADRQPFRGRSTTRDFHVDVRPEGEGAGAPARAEGAVELAPAGWTGRVALLLLVLAVAAVAAGSLFGTGSSTDDRAGPKADPTPAASDCPARDHLSPDANGIVRPDVKPSFDYTFLFVASHGCAPVRFDPCQPVRYALNRRLATDADVADLTEAVAKLSEATGLEFQRVADTDENPRLVPSPRRQPDGTPAWPPVVIGWSHLGTGEALRSPAEVKANPNAVVGGGGRPEVVDDVIVTGNLVLNLDAVTDTDTHDPVPHGFGPGVNWGRIMLHELAHVVGLGHVESRTSIMNEALTQQTISSSQWGAGDLIGLRQLGRASGCVDVPPVPSPGAPR